MPFVGESVAGESSGVPLARAVRRPRWRMLAILLATWLVLAVVGAFVTHAIGARRLSAALDRIRSQGEAVLPSEIAADGARSGTGESGAGEFGTGESGAGEFGTGELGTEASNADATAVWIARIGERAGDQEVFTAMRPGTHVFGVTGRIRLLPTLLPGAPNEVLARLKTIPECSEQLALVSDDVGEFWRIGDERLLGYGELTPETSTCFQLASRARVELNDAGSVTATLEACALEPLSAERTFALMELEDSPHYRFPEAPRFVAASLTARDIARAEAWAGNAPECLAALEAGLCAARTIEDLPSLEAFEAWRTMLVCALSATDVGLQRLPADADTSRLIALLETIDARARARAALVRTRALSNRAFARAAEGRLCGDQQLDEQPFFTRWLALVLLPHQQANQLAAFDTVLTEFDARPAAWPHSMNQNFSFGPRGLLSGDAVPAVGPLLADAGELDARARLTRLALIARKDGTAAAQSASEGALDPFDGRALRLRVDGNQLVLWSIGRDGVDQGGVCKPAACESRWPDDLVVRVRLP